jgi:hypothetical protein
LYKAIAIGLVLVALATLVMTMTTTTVWGRGISGWQLGYEDGRDHPFSQKKLDEIGDSYYHGYITCNTVSKACPRLSDAFVLDFSVSVQLI